MVKNSLNKIGTQEWTSVAYDMAYSHNERWDGNGYPRGLKKVYPIRWCSPSIDKAERYLYNMLYIKWYNNELK